MTFQGTRNYANDLYYAFKVIYYAISFFEPRRHGGSTLTAIQEIFGDKWKILPNVNKNSLSSKLKCNFYSLTSYSLSDNQETDHV